VSTPSTSGVARFVVPPAHDGERIDRFLAAVSGLSRRRVRALIGEGRVWRNQSSSRVLSRMVDTADVIDLLDPPDECRRQDLSIEPLDWILDDPWVAVVAKPAGELSQPAESDPGELAIDDRVRMWIAAREGRRPFVRLIHRLDRPTSGLVVLARTPQALKPLQTAWADGRVQRWYLAVVRGCPEADRNEIQEAIARDFSHPWRFTVDPSGRPASTSARVLHRGGDSALVACSLGTGRTHQVRVHLAHLGHPVLGDALYGGPDDTVPGLRLHAWRLRLPHPKTGDALKIEAPLPPTFAAHLPDGFPDGLDHLLGGTES
jgi:23S rRNA pseudouridine1911/1915/1917 synthase